MEVPLPELQSYHSYSPADDISTPERAEVQTLINLLHMEKHPEGGYFVETDRDKRQMTLEAGHFQPPQYSSNAGETRSLSTSIFYLLTPKNSIGALHRNASRTVHTLHHGRGIYVILKPGNDQGAQQAQVETFRVGRDITQGERLQWIVDGGNYKASFLVSDGTEVSSLLISEVTLLCKLVFGFLYRPRLMRSRR